MGNLAAACLSAQFNAPLATKSFCGSFAILKMIRQTNPLYFVVRSCQRNVCCFLIPAWLGSRQLAVSARDFESLSSWVKLPRYAWTLKDRAELIPQISQHVNISRYTTKENERSCVDRPILGGNRDTSAPKRNAVRDCGVPHRRALAVCRF